MKGRLNSPAPQWHLAMTNNGPIAGSGRCKACSCRGYRPNNPKNDYCHDCGHSWYMHESVG
jgi:hypothetical protein